MDNSGECSTKSILISLLEDIEIVSKELLEYMGTSRQARQDDVDPTQLIVLLKQKDSEFQKYMKIAKEQEELQKEFDELKTEVERRDAHIKFLQKNAKEAEDLLATLMYDAKQKLKSINQARNKKISSEELIKYAHKISAGNSIACPSDWLQGDLRRPYPTELEMKQGLLFSIEHNKSGAQFAQDIQRQMNAGPQYVSMGTPQAGVMSGGHSVNYQPSNEVQSTPLSRLPPSAESTPNMPRMPRDYPPHQHTPLQQQHSQSHKEEVELMSSDSSSSSSSDE